MRRAVLAIAILSASSSLVSGKLPTPGSAEQCGICHRAIYDAWHSSSHAIAMTSPVFLAAEGEAERDYGREARKVCLNCHAPMAARLGDEELTRKVSWEGVTCDYCHSIRSVAEHDATALAEVRFDSVRSGPSKDAISPAHGTAYSEVHASARLCAVCHEYRNGLDFPVITTYSEWKGGPSGRGGVECQRCHMEIVRAAVVDPRIKRDASHLVNLHEMPGSHSQSQLNKALTARLSATRNGELVNVVVHVRNKGVGHAFPTGSPMRQLILEVRALSGGESVGTGSRLYTRVLADAHGDTIQKEYVAFLKAAKVVSDTRLAPEETRAENFSFKVPPGRPVRIEAAFYYRHTATGDPQGKSRIKFLALSQNLP
ncbi:MAG TPA: multiheme c-type cytochrome [Candidatus Polarisedimenticolaceae bacterium]|nr:multiheme c-type cytochrome [Candidatus Polarisedimenticolaceae bacterium]